MLLFAHAQALPEWLQLSPANIAYIVASVLFIFGLKMLGSAKTARKGNFISALGMLVAIAGVCYEGIQAGTLDFVYIGIAAGVGAVIGLVAARAVQMTGIPEMVAVFNGFGGLASLLVGWAEVARWSAGFDQMSAIGGERAFAAAASGIAVLIGGVTFTGSLVAYLKLSGKIDGAPVQFPGQNAINAVLVIGGLALSGLMANVAFGGDAATVGQMSLFLYVIIAASFALGVLVVIPIGGADMPVVIALLNSYSGLAACAAGFVILNNVLIVAGALVGASGLILTAIMCKAMNRSLSNVLFGGMGGSSGGGSKVEGEAKPIGAEDTYYILEAASSVVFVPGYGMAVAQAQHAVRELGEILEANGAEVKYAIHPVAGRMPGHMNVLLAEADVAYEQLVEPEDVNPVMETVDVAIVIGANDVVNPAAREDESSPIYGMPIINVDQARTCIVMKRSLKPGFAGVGNPLFYCDNTRMLFGDAKASTQSLVSEFKESAG